MYSLFCIPGYFINSFALSWFSLPKHCKNQTTWTAGDYCSGARNQGGRGLQSGRDPINRAYRQGRISAYRCLGLFRPSSKFINILHWIELTNNPYSWAYTVRVLPCPCMPWTYLPAEDTATFYQSWKTLDPTSIYLHRGLKLLSHLNPKVSFMLPVTQRKTYKRPLLYF